MEVKINYENLKDLEFYLFSLKLQKELKIRVSFYDSNEVYNYETESYEDYYVIVTK